MDYCLKERNQKAAREGGERGCSAGLCAHSYRVFVNDVEEELKPSVKTDDDGKGSKEPKSNSWAGVTRR